MVLFTEKGGFLLAALTHAVSSGTATPLTRIDRSVFAEFASKAEGQSIKRRSGRAEAVAGSSFPSR